MKKLDCMTRRILLHRVNGCLRGRTLNSRLWLASLAEEAAFQEQYRRERVALRARRARTLIEAPRTLSPAPGGLAPPPGGVSPRSATP